MKVDGQCHCGAIVYKAEITIGKIDRLSVCSGQKNEALEFG